METIIDGSLLYDHQKETQIMRGDCLFSFARGGCSSRLVAILTAGKHNARQLGDATTFGLKVWKDPLGSVCYALKYNHTDGEVYDEVKLESTAVGFKLYRGSIDQTDNPSCVHLCDWTSPEGRFVVTRIGNSTYYDLVLAETDRLIDNMNKCWLTPDTDLSSL